MIVILIVIKKLETVARGMSGGKKLKTKKLY